MQYSKIALVFFTLLFFVACNNVADFMQEKPTPTPTSEPGVLATPRTLEEMAQKVPALADYQAQIKESLQSTPPILLLTDEELTTEAQKLAQELAIQNPEFIEYTVDPLSGQPLRTEMMSVRKAIPGDLTPEVAPSCTQGQCYRVEMYNYVFNVTTVAIVNIETRQVLTVNYHQNAQPEINQRLTELATQIAVNSPEVVEALGLQPGEDAAVMPNVKTALNGSRCERSRHLCVAPTFLVDDRALWAIVDLTDGRLVGTRWTELGQSGPQSVVTERRLQDEYVMENFCETVNSLSQNGWEMDYVITGSDGLKISNVRFEDKAVLNSAKVVDWHVSYSREEGFGYSDAVGCPMFSASSVAAFDGPHVEDIVENGQVVGFALIQDFRSPVWPLPCNYRYENRYEFYNDGRYRIAVANHGRGCGNDGTYRPVMRIDIAASGSSNSQVFSEWDGSQWVAWETEQWQLQDQDTLYTSEGYQYKITRSDDSGYYIEPGQGQFADGGRGDNAYTYVTAQNPQRDEGESDMITIGSCCNTDYQQGPEKFMEPAEPIKDRDSVIWYVPQQKNDDTQGQEFCWADTVIEGGDISIQTWPCYSGPMFVPF